MAKMGRKFSDISNWKGNMKQIGDGSRFNRVKRWRSKSGYYEIVLQKRYAGLTDKEVECRVDFAKDLIAKYLQTKKSLLVLELKKENTTVNSLDTVYYVKQGAYYIGKLSLSTRYYPNKTDLVVLFFAKRLYSPDNHNSTRYRKTH